VFDLSIPGSVSTVDRRTYRTRTSFLLVLSVGAAFLLE
jgi:hypothetical protein